MNTLGRHVTAVTEIRRLPLRATLLQACVGPHAAAIGNSEAAMWCLGSHAAHLEPSTR
jgi:hypothetical protein